MGLKKKGKGPFRGPTPLNIFQTIDIGTGEGRRLKSIARRFPNRKYVAVDLNFQQYDFWEEREGTRSTIEKLTKIGIEVRPQKLQSFIERMKRHTQKTRYVNIDMPTWGWDKDPERWVDEYGFRKLFANASQILLPNGKIFIKTENIEVVKRLTKIAKEEKLKVRPLIEIMSSDLAFSKHLGRDVWRDPTVPPTIFAPVKQLTSEKLKIIEEKIKARGKTKKRGQNPLFGGHPTTYFMQDKFGFYVLEVTFGLKKAIPDKNKRRRWPEP